MSDERKELLKRFKAFRADVHMLADIEGRVISKVEIQALKKIEEVLTQQKPEIDDMKKYVREKAEQVADLIIDQLPGGQHCGKPIELNKLEDFITQIIRETQGKPGLSNPKMMSYEREEFDENTLEGYLVGWKKWLLNLVNITHGGGWRHDDENIFQQILQILQGWGLKGSTGFQGQGCKHEWSDIIQKDKSEWISVCMKCYEIMAGPVGAGGNKMRDEGKGETLDFCKNMYTSRLNALYPSYLHKKLQARFDKKIEQIHQCIQQKPEIDEEYIKEKAVEIYNLSYYKSFKPKEIKEILCQIISEARSGKPKISVAVRDKCIEAVEHVSIYNSNDRRQEAMAMVNNAFVGFEFEEEE